MRLCEDGFVAEAANYGHGLQMWLQIIWFLARTDSKSIVILDEPDVYVHLEQQAKLMDLLRGRFEQCILSTHAVTIIEACSDSEVMRLNRALPYSLQGISQAAHEESVKASLVASHCQPSEDNGDDPVDCM